MSTSTKLILFTALACYSLEQLRSAVCEALCQREEYDRGYYDQKKQTCVCGVERVFAEFTRPPVKVRASVDK